MRRARRVVLSLSLVACRTPDGRAGDAGALSAAFAPEVAPPANATFLARPEAARSFIAVRPAGDMVWVLEGDAAAADVVRVTIADGTRAVVARGAARAGILAATPSSVVYTLRCEGAEKDCAYEARAPGASRRLALARSGGGAAAFAADDDAIYYADRAAASLAIVRAPRDRSPSATLFNRRDARSDLRPSLALDKRWVFLAWEGILWRIPKGGGDAVELARADAVLAPVSDGLYLYWEEGGGAGAGGGRRIRRVAIEPGKPTEPETVATSALAAVGLVADTTHVYWVDASAAFTGSIRRVKKRGAGAPLAGADRGEPFPVGGDVEAVLAVDGAYLYSIDATTHALQRSAK
jgi:hypothetical protein